MNAIFSVRYTTRRPYWQFPADRYIEYGPEDEWWARKFGFGHEADRVEEIIIPRCYVLSSESSTEGGYPHNNITLRVLPGRNDSILPV